MRVLPSSRALIAEVRRDLENQIQGLLMNVAVIPPVLGADIGLENKRNHQGLCQNETQNWLYI